MEQLRYAKEFVDEAFESQLNIEAVFGVDDDFMLEAEDERESLQRTISDYVKATMGHLVKLKRRMNTLVTINRLPEEVFTHIILLSGLSSKETGHSYLLYTWVCCRWRSMIIQNPIFWRSIRIKARGNRDSPIHPFTHEVLQRVKSVQLDMVLISKDLRQFPPTLKNLLANESNRIRRLWLETLNDVDALRMVSATRFPALRGFSYIGGYDGFYRLLPITLASDYLDTLQCDLLHTRDMAAMDRLAAPIFGRIRNLNLSLNRALLQSVLDMLHNNYTLQTLQLRANSYDKINFTSPTILPGLKYLSTDNLSLSEHILAPGLSSLDVFCGYSRIETFPKTFDVSSIKYLYIHNFDENFILGLKERILPFTESLLLTQTKDFVEGFEDVISTEHIQFVKNVFPVDDILSNTCPRNSFRFGFRPSNFPPVLESTLSPFISRMRNLTELYLLHPAILKYRRGIGGIVFQAPSVEKLVVQYGVRLMDSIRPLNDPSLCPRLNHLSYVTFSQRFIPCKGVNDYAEDVGKTLTECLRSRHKVHGGKLEHITLHYCPPLPDFWLEEIQSLGTTVVTAKDVLK